MTSAYMLTSVYVSMQQDLFFPHSPEKIMEFGYSEIASELNT